MSRVRYSGWFSESLQEPFHFKTSKFKLLLVVPPCYVLEMPAVPETEHNLVKHRARQDLAVEIPKPTDMFILSYCEHQKDGSHGGFEKMKTPGTNTRPAVP